MKVVPVTSLIFYLAVCLKSTSCFVVVCVGSQPPPERMTTKQQVVIVMDIATD